MLVSSEKRALQRQVDEGVICSPDTLTRYLWSRGWAAEANGKHSKQGRKIIAIKPGVSGNFQIQVDFSPSAPVLEQPGIWIYALIARHGSDRACYIGQSKAVMRRFAEHSKPARPNHGSSAFFEWVEDRNIAAQAILLEFSQRQDKKGATARNATILEGAWLNAALTAGYEAPGKETWGQLPKSSSVIWRDHEIQQKSANLEMIVENSMPLREFCLKRPEFLKMSELDQS